jgi:hypothetical protein
MNDLHICRKGEKECNDACSLCVADTTSTPEQVDSLKLIRLNLCLSANYVSFNAHLPFKPALVSRNLIILLCSTCFAVFDFPVGKSFLVFFWIHKNDSWKNCNLFYCLV